VADAVLVLGEDVTNTAPMLALALRQAVRRQPIETAQKLGIPEWEDAAVREAVQEDKGPLYIAIPYATKLDEVASRTYHAAPDDVARLGFAVAHELNDQAPQVPDLSEEVHALAEMIARDLQGAKRPLIVSGTGCGSQAVLKAAANVAWALCANGRPAELSLAVPEDNSLGVALMAGGELETAFLAIRDGIVDTVIILENDLYRRAEAADMEAMLEGARHIVAIDHLDTATAQKAEAVLPAATFAEADGSLVNNEGRAQRFYQVLMPDGTVQESWRWLRDAMIAAGRSEVEAWRDLDDVLVAMAKALPVFEAIPDIAPPAGFRKTGQKIPRQPQRYSGRTAMHADVDVSEPKPPDDPDSPLTFSMEGYEGQPPAPLTPRFWAPGWNSIQALNKFQSEVGGPLHGGDPGRRLIEPSQGGEVAYFEGIPTPFKARVDEWLVVPIYHIFGSEELSILTPGVAELAPQPYLGLSAEDVVALHVSEGEEIEVAVGGALYCLPVKSLPSLPSGVAGLPSGLPGFRWTVPSGRYVQVSARKETKLGNAV
jgi:NADH-quinone oxidoreductase subunit G